MGGQKQILSIPDETFHKFETSKISDRRFRWTKKTFQINWRTSKSVDQRDLCCSETLVGGFLGSKMLKCLVGHNSLTAPLNWYDPDCHFHNFTITEPQDQEEKGEFYANRTSCGGLPSSKVTKGSVGMFRRFPRKQGIVGSSSACCNHDLVPTTRPNITQLKSLQNRRFDNFS